jgi:hypothetical protein
MLDFIHLTTSYNLVAGQSRGLQRMSVLGHDLGPDQGYSYIVLRDDHDTWDVGDGREASSNLSTVFG